MQGVNDMLTITGIIPSEQLLKKWLLVNQYKQFAAENMISEEASANQSHGICAPRWIEVGGGILCIPGLFRMMDSPEAIKNNCWQGR